MGGFRPPPPQRASMKNVADLIEISTGQVHETGAEMGAGFADSGAGFRKLGAEL